MSFIDSTGQLGHLAVGFAVGFAFDIALQLIIDGPNCIDWRQAIISGVAGAAGVGWANKVANFGKASKLARANKNPSGLLSPKEQLFLNTAAGGVINGAAGQANNIFDKNPNTKFGDNFNRDFAVGMIGSAAGSLFDPAAAGALAEFDFLPKFFGERGLATGFGNRAAKEMAGGVSNLATQTPNIADGIVESPGNCKCKNKKR